VLLKQHLSVIIDATRFIIILAYKGLKQECVLVVQGCFVMADVFITGSISGKSMCTTYWCSPFTAYGFLLPLKYFAGKKI
jgi:hypothetical protein